jgi:hypothetical protein
MKHPVSSDFHTVVTKAGLSVTFKPTNSTYIFVAEDRVTARLGPVSFMGVQHGRHKTEGYNSDEVEAMARQVASEPADPSQQLPDLTHPVRDIQADGDRIVLSTLAADLPNLVPAMTCRQNIRHG